MAWNKQAKNEIAWAQVKTQLATGDGGIDFEFQVRREGPILLSADRPLLLMSSISGGQP